MARHLAVIIDRAGDAVARYAAAGVHRGVLPALVIHDVGTQHHFVNIVHPERYVHELEMVRRDWQIAIYPKDRMVFKRAAGPCKDAGAF